MRLRIVVLSCLILSCLILSCLILSCPVLTCDLLKCLCYHTQLYFLLATSSSSPHHVTSYCRFVTSTFHFTMSHLVGYFSLFNSLENKTGVCALYLHCVALLKDTLQQVSSLAPTIPIPTPIPKGPKGQPVDSINNNLNLSLNSNANQIALDRLQKVRDILFF